MEIVPITLRTANDFVAEFHRHSDRTTRNGGKFAIGLVSCGTDIIGVAIVGLPVARLLNDGYTAEVTRVCVRPDSQKGACSKLYSRCWKIWRAMGGRRLITYTLQSESGASLRGAGWRIVGAVKPQKWDRNGRERVHKPVYDLPKFRWETGETGNLELKKGYCRCGCGKIPVYSGNGRRAFYFSNACRQRHFRRQKRNETVTK